MRVQGRSGRGLPMICLPYVKSVLLILARSIWCRFGGRVMVHTTSIACATLSDWMSPLFLRFAISAALLEPEENQAILGWVLGA